MACIAALAGSVALLRVIRPPFFAHRTVRNPHLFSATPRAEGTMAVAMERHTIKATISKKQEVKHTETGSPFSMTMSRSAAVERPGELRAVAASASASAGSPGKFDDNAFSPGRKTAKPDPRRFLHKHEGWGGTPTATVAAKVKASHPEHALSPPAKAGATKPRSNPPNTKLRMMYERGDLPCIIDQGGVHNKLAWTVSVHMPVCVDSISCVRLISQVKIEELEFSHYLPAFFDGLREEEEPYRFIAAEGVTDLLEHGPPNKVSALTWRATPPAEAAGSADPGDHPFTDHPHQERAGNSPTRRHVLHSAHAAEACPR
jgi:hypothetical protein